MNGWTFSFMSVLAIIASILLLAWEQAVAAAELLIVVAFYAVGATLALLPVAVFAAGVWALSNRWIDNLQKRAEASKLAAEAKQAEWLAANQVVTAKAGEQVFIASEEDISGRAITALHLQRSFRSNGGGDAPDSMENVAWAAMQQAHSTASRPGAVTNNHGPVLDAPPAVELPERVDLLQLIGSGSTSIERMIMGQAVNDERLETVTMPLAEMVHVGIVGSSGWGKSVGVQSLALQLALAAEPLEMAFIDLEGVTSAPFQQLSRLRYPIAYFEGDAVAVLDDLKGEMDRRMALFGPHRVQQLSQYNALGVEAPLPYIAVFIDEATTILENNAAIHNLVAESVIQLRKAGVFLFLAGQEMSSKSMRPMIRRQLSSRMAYHVGDHWQAQGLGIGREAVELNTKGRAWTVFPGRRKVKMQTPFIEATVIEGRLAQAGRLNGGAAVALPSFGSDDERRIYEAVRANPGASFGEIARAIGRSRSTHTNKMVRDVIDKFDLACEIGREAPVKRA